jgi:hypothetical protein
VNHRCKAEQKAHNVHEHPGTPTIANQFRAKMIISEPHKTEAVKHKYLTAMDSLLFRNLEKGNGHDHAAVSLRIKRNGFLSTMAGRYAASLPILWTRWDRADNPTFMIATFGQ